MTHGSLFSGIGGFDLAAEWMGWQNVFHCEINPFGKKILKHYWPDADSYEDIKTTDFTIYRGRIDVLSGGFPCQPFSLAGKRKGAEDDRYLWPEMLRAIDEIRPRWVIGENVAGLVSMVQPEIDETDLESQTNLQGEIDSQTVQEYQQYVVETVCSDLEHLGYSVQPIIVPACAIGAPHRRDRIWFVAYASSDGSNRTPNEASNSTRRQNRNEIKQPTIGSKVRSPTNSDNTRANDITDGFDNEWAQKDKKWRGESQSKFGACCCNGNDANTYVKILQGEPNGRDAVIIRQKSEQQSSRLICSTWSQFPTQPPVCSRDDGVPNRLDGITFSKWRSESIKAYGNAVVPQVVHEIFKGIEKISNP